MSIEGQESNKPDLRRQAKSDQRISGKEDKPSSPKVGRPDVPTFSPDPNLKEISPGAEEEARIDKLLGALDKLKGESKSTPPPVPSDTPKPRKI